MTALQGSARSEDDLVATIPHLVNTGRVVLCGTFAGTRIVRPTR